MAREKISRKKGDNLDIAPLARSTKKKRRDILPYRWKYLYLLNGCGCLAGKVGLIYVRYAMRLIRPACTIEVRQVFQLCWPRFSETELVIKAP